MHMIYLEILIMRSRKFKCTLKHAEKSFYPAANAVFQRLVVM